MISQELINQLEEVDIVCVTNLLSDNQSKESFVEFKYVDLLNDIYFQVYRDDLSFSNIINTCFDAIYEQAFKMGVSHGEKQFLSRLKTLLEP